MTDAGAEVFDGHLDARQRTPWGRIRYRVVAETLARTWADQRSGPPRVLDLGGGDGADSLPLARAGHDVTVVDIPVPLLGGLLAELESLELALCDREPYLRVARFWQLVARRSRGSS